MCYTHISIQKCLHAGTHTHIYTHAHPATVSSTDTHYWGKSPLSSTFLPSHTHMGSQFTVFLSLSVQFSITQTHSLHLSFLLFSHHGFPCPTSSTLYFISSTRWPGFHEYVDRTMERAEIFFSPLQTLEQLRKNKRFCILPPWERKHLSHSHSLLSYQELSHQKRVITRLPCESVKWIDGCDWSNIGIIVVKSFRHSISLKDSMVFVIDLCWLLLCMANWSGFHRARGEA